MKVYLVLTRFILVFLCTSTLIFGADDPMNVFVEPGNPRLSSPVPEVPVDQICSKEIQAIIDQMYHVAAPERSDVDARVMVGLAAPQIGIYKQIILVDLSVTATRCDLGELRAFINPKIVWRSEEIEFEREGCYSVDSRICGVVPRASKIRITAYDRQGNFIKEELSGFTARIFQHEVDHLQGVRFPDRVGEEGHLHWVEGEEYPEYKKRWQEWPVEVSQDVWKAMKEGRPYEAVKK